MKERRVLAYLVAVGGMLSIAAGAICARIAQGEGVESLAVAAWRLTFAALAVAPVAIFFDRASLRAMTLRQLGLALLAGTFLALHFALWIRSLALTSVASSTVLVTTNPIWIALVGFLFLRERFNRTLLSGMALALAGSLAIFWSDRHTGGADSLWGNFLALAGAWCFSAYLLLGHRLRARLTLPAYVFSVYASAAVLLMLACLLSGTPLSGWSSAGWQALLLLALLPQVVGHTAYNWSLRHVSAAFVAIVTLGEPVGSSLLAWLIFGEQLGGLQALGFVLLLLGIGLAALGENQRTAARALAAQEG